MSLLKSVDIIDVQKDTSSAERREMMHHGHHVQQFPSQPFDPLIFDSLTTDHPLSSYWCEAFGSLGLVFPLGHLPLPREPIGQ
ncbi:hypothetical protein VM1G_11555 [Cytospora mali]|uniref:Uncharacterized protein n=1 Tax=Cytospora mali TaxID=578113 RepID=A0A194VW37_CYTMA|nr:hypothetical protein VM1G_11555 [Valsa mali]